MENLENIESGRFRIVDTPQWSKERESFKRVLGPEWEDLVNQAYMFSDNEMITELRRIRDNQLSLFPTVKKAV